MKKFIFNFLIFIFIVGGIAVLAYPFVGFWYADKTASYAIQEYDDTLSKMEEAERIAEWERAKAYNDNLQMGSITDPFTQSPSGMSEEYYSLLNFGNKSVMAYISIPKINSRLPIYHGTSSKTLERGVGHLEGSSLPVGGMGTHSILTGHTGLKSAVLFTNLTELVEGDEFYIFVLDDILAYRVDQITVIEPTDTDMLRYDADKDYITLVTCTPYGVNSHRLLVRGERVPYEKEEIEEIIEQTPQVMDQMTMILIAIAIVFGLICLVFVILAVRRKKKSCRRE